MQFMKITVKFEALIKFSFKNPNKFRWNTMRGKTNANEDEDSTSNCNNSDDYLRLNATAAAN